MGDQKTSTVGHGKQRLKRAKEGSIYGSVRPQGPCEKIDGCELPEKKELPLKKWSGIGDLIDALLKSDKVEITLNVDRLILPTDKGIDLVVRGWLQFYFEAQKHKQESEESEDDKPMLVVHSRIWRHSWWKYKKPSVDVGEPLDQPYRAMQDLAMDRWEADMPSSAGLKWLTPSPYDRAGEKPGDPIYGAITRIGEWREKYMPTSTLNLHESNSNYVHERRGFDNVQKEALRYIVDFMQKFVGELDKEWLNKNKHNLEVIQKGWIEVWLPIFPTRRLPVIRQELFLKCPKCKKKWKYQVGQSATKEHEIIPISEIVKDIGPQLKKKTICPHCNQSIQPKVVCNVENLLQVLVTFDLPDEKREPIRRKRDEKYEVTPLTVNFNLAEPHELEQPADDEVLPRHLQLKEVATELGEHLRILDEEGIEPLLVVRGYTDPSGSCEYNNELSQRRADWVINKLKSDCNLKLPPEESIKTIGCGKAYSGDKQFKELWKKEREKRKTSGKQPVDENEAERVVVIELCAPEKKKSK